MINQFSRTELNLGPSAIEKLNNAKVAIFGIGGVGGYVVEALARSGIKKFVLVDDDKVCLSNINRQIIATLKTIGQYKVDVMKERILEINNEAEVEVHKCFFLPNTADEFDFTEYDYVVDAVDTVSAKLLIVEKAKANNIPVVSAMGAGNKINPTMFEVSDISKTKVDPLAKVMRRELKKRKIYSLKVVYSKEKPLKTISGSYDEATNASLTRTGTSKKEIPGSNAFTPSVMGLIIASEIIKDITGIRNDIMGA